MDKLNFLIVFVAGFLTFFTPCVLPIIPIYFSTITGNTLEELKEHKRVKIKALVLGCFFMLGFSLVFIMLGLSTTFLGQLFFLYKELLKRVGGIVIVLFGLHFLGFLPYRKLLKTKSFKKIPTSDIQIFNSFLIGFFFAFSWSPCIGPILATVLTYTTLSSPNLLQGSVMLCLFSLGLALPFLLSSCFIDYFLRFRKKFNHYIDYLMKFMGMILVFMGLLLFLNCLSFFFCTSFM